MMIDPATEAAHTDDEIAELEELLVWLRRYRAICVGGPVLVEVWERRVQGVGARIGAYMDDKGARVNG